MNSAIMSQKSQFEMKNFVVSSLFLLLVLFTSSASAQQPEIKGKVVDEKQAPINLVNVALMKGGDSSFIGGTLTDATGRFVFSHPGVGSYFLRFTSIGFHEKRTELFTLSGSEEGKDFGVILLKSDAKTLKEVSVTAMRPTITQLADRMVVNIEGTAMAAGNSAFNVLGKSPGVFIDPEGNIQLNGRSGVTVMINGKLTYMSARDLRTMLESMPAENIKSIEIITNPSAKYDAEGSSGMLNIILRKNTNLGMNGSINTGYNFNGKQHGYNIGGTINHNIGKWNSFMNVDYSRRVGGREATFTRVFYAANKTTYFDQEAIGNFVAQGPPNVRVGTDYSFNNNHSIGVMGYFNRNTGRQEFLTETLIGSAPKQPTQFIDADNYSTNTFQNITTNLHYQGKFDSIGTTFTTDLDYVRITNRGSSDFFNFYTNLSDNQQIKDFLYTYVPNGYNIYSGKMDFTKPYANGRKLEMGLKASQVTSDNDNRFYFNNNGLVADPRRSNHFIYRENIYAAYMNIAGKISKRISFQGGLRAENTKSVGRLITTGRVDKRDYLDFFPSLFIQQKISDNYGINYNYSRRLNRPNYGNLNPFKAYRDPYTWYEGNPYLRPQYAHAITITQTLKKLYNVTLSYTESKDVMAEIPILDEVNATTVYTTGNVNEGKSYGMSAVAPLKITKKWDTQNTMVLSYNKFEMNAQNGPLVNEQLFYMFQSNHTIQLPKAIRMELNLMYRGPAASGLYHMAAMHRVDVGFKRSFLNKKLDVSLNANDLFKGFRYFWTTDINGNVNEFDQYFRIRNVGFSLRYNFSKGQKVENKRRNTSVDEVNRT